MWRPRTYSPSFAIKKLDLKHELSNKNRHKLNVAHSSFPFVFHVRKVSKPGWSKDILCGVAYLHAVGVSKYCKLIGREGRIKICDFGLA